MKGEGKPDEGAAEVSVIPVVRRPRSGVPGSVIAAGAIFSGILLFSVLDARRRASSAPAVHVRNLDAAGTSATPATLYIPPEPPGQIVQTQTPIADLMLMPAAVRTPAPVPTLPATSAPVSYTPAPQPVALGVQAPAMPPRINADAALVIDTTGTSASAPSGEGSASGNIRQASQSQPAGPRVSAGALANRATTVPQGTLIPAVLENALDSTQPGLARALVSRDIRGFDGSRILIPRGSRLIGEYDANVQAGQKRMLVNWVRLIRPDGSTIAIGSPGGDTLGQGGIRASVNTHFLERFSGAILQSALNVGVNLAARATESPVIVALPGSLQGQATAPTSTSQVSPTLKVKRATSISIFVARDLDFTGVEAR